MRNLSSADLVNSIWDASFHQKAMDVRSRLWRNKQHMLLFVFCFLGATIGIAQSSFTCGSNVIIDVDVRGLLNDNDNCVNIGNTNNMVATTAEVWIERSDCSGNLPNTIQISGGGQTVTASGTNVTQTSSSGVPERLYRARIPGSFSQVCISNLSGCDATSIALYTERSSDNASSFTALYDSEFHNNGCIARTVNIGTSSIIRDFELRVPIHEKSNDGREVVLESDIRAGNTAVSYTHLTLPTIYSV